jgi:hypothetical protein
MNSEPPSGIFGNVSMFQQTHICSENDTFTLNVERMRQRGDMVEMAREGVHFGFVDLFLSISH